ncbi:MAG TPA: efflux RND transporter periplasmic adaptor subunit [Bryobacteraceae bacterium]|jgi:HlyD family secretion protein|nr:efflux RND transporter periplasmic adaptor subunit [Bryobacteraceae bacterium]
MKKFILIFILIAAVATAGVLVYMNLHPTVTDRIRVSGNIELTEVDIAFKTAGRLIERNVDEGDEVKKGMVVARLDRDQLMQQREAQVAALHTAEAQLAESQSAAEWQRNTMAADLDVRRSDLSSAESRLLEMKNGARPEEIQEAAAAVDGAQAGYDGAKKDWDRAQTLYKNDDISTSQYDQFRKVLDSASASLKQAKQHSALVNAGNRSEDIENASAQASKARASLKMGEANSLELQRREQDIEARRGDIARTKAQIVLIDSQLSDTIAISPVSGVVLVKAADVGEVLAPGTSIVTVGDIDHPWLRAYVPENQLGRVKLGSKVKVTTDSYPGKIYDGRVSFISSEAEFTPKQIESAEERVKLVYRIKIDIDNPHRELKSNMPADAEVLAGN